MKELNQATYNLLLKAKIETRQILAMRDGPDWYELTYDMFKVAPLESINDFWKIVAYTYSWMPTIPDVKAHEIKNASRLLVNLKALKKGDDSQLKELFEELIPVINNSLVGTSKVLHFIAPNSVRIIDRNVLRGWDLFFSAVS